MRTRTKVLMILVAGLGLILLIGKLYNEDDNRIQKDIQINDETTTETTTSSAVTTTHKTTKKVVKTTQKTTKAVTKVNKVATGTKTEYLSYAKEYGNLNDTQLQCLDYLWTHESGWNANSVNKSTGACGIPQAYPCKKIAQSEGSNDWKAQIRWGLKYVNRTNNKNSRYLNPCSAWNHFKNKKWY